MRHRERSPSLKVTKLESHEAKAEILTARTQHPPCIPAHSPPLRVTNRDAVSEENELATGRPVDREGSVTGSGNTVKAGWRVAEERGTGVSGPECSPVREARFPKERLSRSHASEQMDAGREG